MNPTISFLFRCLIALVFIAAMIVKQVPSLIVALAITIFVLGVISFFKK